MSSSLFVKYGVKAGGGPPFLKRTRTAYAQVQQRTRSGSSFSQRQQRNGTCNCVATGGFQYYYWSTNTCCDVGTGCKTQWYENGIYACWALGTPSSYVSGTCCFYYYSSPSSWPGWGSTLNHYQVGCGSACSWAISIEYYSDQPQSCSASYGGWFNVSSCSADTNCAWNGRSLRDCRTVTGCNWGAWSGWSNVSSCSPSSSCSSNGGRECQTIYLWNNWSAWEEAETCTPQTPNAANGAVQIECQAI